MLASSAAGESCGPGGAKKKAEELVVVLHEQCRKIQPEFTNRPTGEETYKDRDGVDIVCNAEQCSKSGQVIHRLWGKCGDALFSFYLYEGTCDFKSPQQAQKDQSGFGIPGGGLGGFILN